MPVALFKKQFEALIFNQNAYIAKYILYKKGTLDHFPPLVFCKVCSQNPVDYARIKFTQKTPEGADLSVGCWIGYLVFGGLDGFETGRFRLHFVVFPDFFLVGNFLNLVFCNEIAEF